MRCARFISMLLAFMLACLSCSKDPVFELDSATGESLPSASRLPSDEVRHVMIMVSAGYNSLSGYLKEDLKELAEGYLPKGKYRSANVLLVLSRTTDSYGDYNTSKPMVLYRLYSDLSGNAVADTLKIWQDTPICKADNFNEAMQFIYNRFPAKDYGMVFSSHASGWLPAEYYNDPDTYEYKHGAKSLRSIGQDKMGTVSYEMELKELIDAIPFKLSYFLLDACLSGCVEVAYAFKDKADIVGFSPTEVLANGFDYLTITQHLLMDEPDPVAVCKDYFAYYDAQTGSSRSATISVVDTREMEPLAKICETLFEKYRDQIKSLNGNLVQGYFRFDRHFFYDLKDILLKAGITAEEESALDEALDRCVIYKAATPYFLSIPINTYSGLSMYLPSMGTTVLDQFYKEQISWNAATKLVK